MSNAPYKSARQEGYLLCRHCHTLHTLDQQDKHCHVCKTPLHSRMEHTLQRSWAFLLASVICFFPANLLPIMTFKSFGSGAPSTIMGGIIELFSGGFWGIGLVVLIASIIIPCLKILGMLTLLLSLKFHWRTSARQKTWLYRGVEWVGRWSMLDIFVIAVLVALVQLGSLASISPGHGATAFAAVVILTMLSALNFDTRLIWDKYAPTDTRHHDT